MRTELTLLTTTLALLVGACATDDDSTDATLDTTVADTTIASDSSTSDADKSDVPIFAGPTVDIEAFRLDLDDQCIGTEMVVLGQGHLEPPIFIPHCLEHTETGTRYLARPGSRELPEGFDHCESGDTVGWRMCGTPRCTDEDESGQMVMRWGCRDLVIEPQCGTLNPQDVAVTYWHPILQAGVLALNVTLDEPWIEVGAVLPEWFQDYDYQNASEPCPEDVP